MGRFGALKIPATVGVIASPEELRTAKRMRRPPDLFELRLDYLPGLNPREIYPLRRPLIITARHPAEGGCSRGSARERFRRRRPRRRGPRASSTQTRRDLLLKWLPFAQFVDVELRSLYELREVWDDATRLKIKRICSIHDFARTPPHALLQKQFQRAKKAGADIFKLVTRADTSDDLLALLQFLRRAGDSGSRGRSPSPRQAGAGIECCVMATGRFGPFSRYLFPECGSVFVYAALRRPLYAGQVTLEQLRFASKQGIEETVIPRASLP